MDKRKPWFDRELALSLLASNRFFASAQAVSDGGVWYQQAREHVEAFALAHNRDVQTCAAVVATLSPQVSWAQNLRMAEECLAGGVPRGISSVVRKACELRDASLTRDRPAVWLDVRLRGEKVRAFYHAIMGDQRAVVVDRWMLRACGCDRKSVSPKQYAEVVAVIREAAATYGEPAREFQAIVWCHVRGKSF